MVSAQMGGDGKSVLASAEKLGGLSPLKPRAKAHAAAGERGALLRPCQFAIPRR